MDTNLILVMIHLFPIFLFPLKVTRDARKTFKVIITARDDTNRSLRIEKQGLIAQKKSSMDFSQH
jgi:hypothetical protein